MKLTILTDNTVLQSKKFLAEHGLSFYLEMDGKKVLFDTGYSDVFIKNAVKMGINLLDLDYIVLSHGHNDHTSGLNSLISFYIHAKKEKRKITQKPIIITHPETFNKKVKEDFGEIGCIVSIEELKKLFDIKLSTKPLNLTENLTFLGEIPRKNDFEAKKPLGKVIKSENLIDDYIKEDSALVFEEKNGIVVITGCSHAGICNIAECAKEKFPNKKIIDIIGGFHLINASEETLSKTTDYLSAHKIKYLHPCHCTDFQSKLFLSSKLNVIETGIGTILRYEN